MSARSLRHGLAGALAALALPGCGLLGPDASQTPAPSDGTTGFGSSEAIELCVDRARVVAPANATGATAICVPKGAKGRACASDGACRGLERCTCGVCVVTACEGTAPCGDGEVCRGKRCTQACTTDAACATGERCISGGCARACAGDAACAFGERCDPLDGVCAVSLCGGGLACGPGEECLAQAVIGELHEPELVTIAGAPVAFVELRQGATSVVLRARRDDPLRWVADPVVPVLAGANGLALGAPSALVDGARVELWVAIGAGAGIGHAVSTDGGRTFALDAAPVLVPEAAWERGAVGSPSVVEHAGARYLFYEGGAGAGIGLASLDASGAHRLGAGPIAAPSTIEDATFWRGVTAVGTPYALAAGDVVRVYFTGRGAEGADAVGPSGPLPADVNDSIGMVATTDLARFDHYPTGPVYARMANLRAYLGEREPAVALDDAGPELVFVGADASGRDVSGLARAKAP